MSESQFGLRQSGHGWACADLEVLRAGFGMLFVRVWLRVVCFECFIRRACPRLRTYRSARLVKTWFCHALLTGFPTFYREVTLDLFYAAMTSTYKGGWKQLHA